MKGGGFGKCLTKPQVEDTIKRTLKIRNALLPSCVKIVSIFNYQSCKFCVRLNIPKLPIYSDER